MLMIRNAGRSNLTRFFSALSAIVAAQSLIGCGGRTSSDSPGAAGHEPAAATPKANEPTKDAPQAASAETLAVIIGEEVRLLSSAGSSRQVLNGSSFFSGISGAHFAGRVGDYFAIEGYPAGETQSMRLAVVSGAGSVEWQKTFAWSEAVRSDNSWVSLGNDGTAVFKRDNALLSALPSMKAARTFPGPIRWASPSTASCRSSGYPPPRRPACR